MYKIETFWYWPLGKEWRVGRRWYYQTKKAFDLWWNKHKSRWGYKDYRIRGYKISNDKYRVIRRHK